MAFLFGTVIIVLLISFLCSMTEAVLLSLNVHTIPPGDSPKTKRIASAWQRMKRNIGRPIAAILVLDTIINTGGSVIACYAFLDVFGDQYLWLFSIFMTTAILFGTEILPMVIGMEYSRHLAPFMAIPLEIMTTILSPFIWLSDLLMKPFQKTSGAVTSQVTTSDILTLASLARAGKVIGNEQENIIVNAIRLNHTPVNAVMIPREKIRYLINNLPLEENKKRLGGVFTNTRYPICSEDSIDSVIGTLNHKKFEQKYGEKSSDFSLMARKLVFVDENVTMLQALRTMMSSRLRMIFVKDKNNRIAGMITLENITNELVYISLPD